MQEEKRMKAKEEAMREAKEALENMELEDKETLASETQGGTQETEAADSKAAGDVLKLEETLKAKEAELEETKNRLLRLQADFDNFRRRNLEEQGKLSQYVTSSVAKEFLKVLDNFERAEESLVKTTEGDALKVGMEKIHKQFEQALATLKIIEIKAQGETFDPEFHEAVMQGTNPEAKDDTIDLVLEKGYKIGDHVIRHSKVRVVHN